MLLPTDILQLIFSYCPDEVFDNILIQNDIILMNFLTNIGMHKELFLYLRPPNYGCYSQYHDICKYVDKIYVKRYIFNYCEQNKYKIINPTITQIVPFNFNKYQFEIKRCCDPTTQILNNKNTIIVYSNIHKIISYIKKNTLMCDNIIVDPIISPNIDPTISYRSHSFRIYPEQHQPSGHFHYSKFELCTVCSERQTQIKKENDNIIKKIIKKENNHIDKIINQNCNIQ